MAKRKKKSLEELQRELAFQKDVAQRERETRETRRELKQVQVGRTKTYRLGKRLGQIGASIGKSGTQISKAIIEQQKKRAVPLKVVKKRRSPVKYGGLWG